MVTGKASGAPPNVIHWTPRSGEHGDCAVVAISLATGFTYEEALSACLQANPAALEAGMSERQIKTALDLLGFKARCRKVFDLDDDTGILWVSSRGDHHVVYLWAGRIVNPSKFDRTALWLDAEEYLKNGQWKAPLLITVEE